MTDTSNSHAVEIHATIFILIISRS